MTTMTKKSASEPGELTDKQKEQIQKIWDDNVEPAIGKAVELMIKRVLELASQKTQSKKDAERQAAAALLSVAIIEASELFTPDQLRTMTRVLIQKIADERGLM